MADERQRPPTAKLMALIDPEIARDPERLAAFVRRLNELAAQENQAEPDPDE